MKLYYNSLFGYEAEKKLGSSSSSCACSHYSEWMCMNAQSVANRGDSNRRVSSCCQGRKMGKLYRGTIELNTKCLSSVLLVSILHARTLHVCCYICISRFLCCDVTTLKKRKIIPCYRVKRQTDTVHKIVKAASKS